ncbi:hypothetical protein [Desulfoluna sp.]|uniref:hypothetical protein n=1 Tax=Desulfoluna sp. TaxID=2045199 RepID=UPI00260F19BF|nr:hypothetical protein [Desulfoluna sp.]
MIAPDVMGLPQPTLPSGLTHDLKTSVKISPHLFPDFSLSIQCARGGSLFAKNDAKMLRLPPSAYLIFHGLVLWQERQRLSLTQRLHFLLKKI